MIRIFILLLSFCSLNIQAQTYSQHYAASTFISSTIISSDNYIYALSQRYNNQLYIIKQTLSGQLVWQKFYNVSASEVSFSCKIKETPGGNFLILFNSAGNNFCLFKIDASGNFLMGKEYIMSAAPANVRDMEMDNSGNIYVMGNLFFLMKIDSSGSILWIKKYNNNMSYWYPNDDIGTMVYFNGNLLIQAATHKDSVNYGYRCYALHTIDTAGNIISNIILSDTVSCASCASGIGEVIPLNNGRIIYSAYYGISNGQGRVIMNMDASGQVYWRRWFKCFNTIERVRTLVFNNHEIYMAYAPDLAYDLGLSKFDSTGNHLWSKGYGNSLLSAYASNMLITPDNGLILSGQRHYFWDQAFIAKIDTSFTFCNTFPFNPTPPLNNIYPSLDVPNTYSITTFSVPSNVITETDSLSTYQLPTCFTTGNNIFHDESFISLSPNPTTAEVTINFSNASHYNVQLRNTLGEVLEQTQINSATLSLNISSYPKGIYFVTVSDESRGLGMVVRKVVKM